MTAAAVNVNPRRGAMTTLIIEKRKRRNTENINHTNTADTAGQPVSHTQQLSDKPKLEKLVTTTLSDIHSKHHLNVRSIFSSWTLYGNHFLYKSKGKCKKKKKKKSCDFPHLS